MNKALHPNAFSKSSLFIDINNVTKKIFANFVITISCLISTPKRLPILSIFPKEMRSKLELGADAKAAEIATPSRITQGSYGVNIVRHHGHIRIPVPIQAKGKSIEATPGSKWLDKRLGKNRVFQVGMIVAKLDFPSTRATSDIAIFTPAKLERAHRPNP